MDEKKEVLDNQEKEEIEVKAEDVVDNPTSKPETKDLIAYIFWITTFVALAAFIILSLTVKGPFGPYGLSGWGFWWIFFLLIPVVVGVYESFSKKNPELFPVIFIVVIAYLLVGLLTTKWHPYWALLFIIPAYHIIISNVFGDNPFKNKTKKKKQNK